MNKMSVEDIKPSEVSGVANRATELKCSPAPLLEGGLANP
jgi:hypothetical protein